MPLSKLLILIYALLITAGIGRRSLRNIGAGGMLPLYFLLCIFVTDRLSASYADEVYLSPACLLIPVWLYAAACFGAEKTAWLALPVSVLLGVILAPLVSRQTELAQAAVGAAAALTAFILPLPTALSTAALTPVAASVSAFVYAMITNGFAELDLSEGTLSAQLIGVGLAFVLSTSIQSQKHKSILSSGAS